MEDEVSEYIQYILNLVEIKRPKMPSFPISAYTDNEYTSAIFELLNDFKFADSDILNQV